MRIIIIDPAHATGTEAEHFNEADDENKPIAHADYHHLVGCVDEDSISQVVKNCLEGVVAEERIDIAEQRGTE